MEPIVRYGFPWWLRLFVRRGIGGITLGRRVYVSSADDRLLRHELAHARQIERLGAWRFYTRYVREYAANRRRGLSRDDAYREISLEIEAFAAEEEESV